MSDTAIASLDFRFQRLSGARVAPQQSPILQTTFFTLSLTCQRCNFFATCGQPLGATFFSSRFELSITGFDDLFGSASKLVRWCHVVDRAVKPNVIVMLNIIGNSLHRFFDRARTRWSNALVLQRTVPSLKLAVALRIVWTGSHVGEDTHKHLEVLGDELRPVVADDSRFSSRRFFQRLLQNHFDIFLFHLLADTRRHRSRSPSAGVQDLWRRLRVHA